MGLIYNAHQRSFPKTVKQILDILGTVPKTHSSPLLFHYTDPCQFFDVLCILAIRTFGCSELVHPSGDHLWPPTACFISLALPRLRTWRKSPEKKPAHSQLPLFCTLGISTRNLSHVSRHHWWPPLSHFEPFELRLHVVMIPSYKTPMEVLRMALHVWDLGVTFRNLDFTRWKPENEWGFGTILVPFWYHLIIQYWDNIYIIIYVYIYIYTIIYI
jgi:hypothetical protein